MEPIRKPFQGVWNIVRFNWHFFVLATVLTAGLFGLGTIASAPVASYLNILTGLIAVSVLVSLLTSLYVYDLSDLYTLSWLDFLKAGQPQNIVTIHAGFDETSALIQRKFPDAHLRVFDFYDPLYHTELSIQQARKAYLPYPGTETIQTKAIPLDSQTVDVVLLILSAHEIRQATERVQFFFELNRVLKPAGQVIVVEHLRDGVNFLGYNLGFFHFLSRSTWLTTFSRSAFVVHRSQKITPFITVFTLCKDDSPA